MNAWIYAPYDGQDNPDVDNILIISWLLEFVWQLESLHEVQGNLELCEAEKRASRERWEAAESALHVARGTLSAESEAYNREKVLVDNHVPIRGFVKA